MIGRRSRANPARGDSAADAIATAETAARLQATRGSEAVSSSHAARVSSPVPLFHAERCLRMLVIACGSEVISHLSGVKPSISIRQLRRRRARSGELSGADRKRCVDQQHIPQMPRSCAPANAACRAPAGSCRVSPSCRSEAPAPPAATDSSPGTPVAPVVRVWSAKWHTSARKRVTVHLTNPLKRYAPSTCRRVLARSRAPNTSDCSNHPLEVGSVW